MTIQEFPKMLYRAEGAEVHHFVVTTPAALEAAKAEGWGDRRAALAEAEKAPRPVAANAKPDANAAKEQLALIEKLNKAQAVSASKDEMIAAKDDVIQAQGDELVAVRGFIGQLRDDVNCPAELKAAIDELLGDAEPAKAQKSKGKAKA